MSTEVTASESLHNVDGNYIEVKRGLLSWLFTLDHKRIGILYLVSVLVGFFGGGVFALLLRLKHLMPGTTIMSATTYNQLFTLHGAFMIFLFVLPAIPGALGNFVLPIMLGAKDVAFPRLNLASWWIFIAGAILAVVGMLVGKLDTGWTFYTPYSSRDSASVSVLWMTMALFVMGFSGILTGLNFIATIHKMRAEGLTWARLPLFAWGMYATAIIQILATPVLAITLLLLFMEKFFGIGIFDPRQGGDPILFQHFFWFYSHPAVYIMILPGMAIVSEIIATFSRHAIFGPRAIAISSIALALLGFFVWGHHLFVSGMSEYATMVFSALTFLVAIPSGVKVFNWVATLYRGSITLVPPMLYALGFIVLFAIGGLTGLFLATPATDVHLHDTYFVVAHFHYVMMGGTFFGFLGGLHYWWPKMTGRLYDQKRATMAFVLVFIGFNVTFLSQFVMGVRGMPRRYYDYLPQYQGMHTLSTVGAFVLAAGLTLVALVFISSLRSGKRSPPNPWGSAGFEWQTATPPHAHNFKTPPVITRGPYDYHVASEAELFDGFPDEAKSS